MIRINLLLIFLVGLTLTVSAENDTTYQFEKLIELPTTSVKNQHRSGTCWSFSSASYIESEMMRMGKDSIDLSEMFVVRHCYQDKAERYVRMHGNLNFGAGGAFGDFFYVLDHYGLVPEEAYKGLNYGEEKHVHGEMDNVLKSYVDAVIPNKNKKLSTAWKNGFSGICDAYLGELPEEFSYKGKTYSPESFAKDVVGIQSSDYVSLTSYTHQPLYSSFALAIPDNWLWHLSYNLTLDELMEVMYNALETGYSIAWGGDVSDKGFSFKNGLAILPDVKVEEMSDSERSKWEKLTQKEKDKKQFQFDHPVKEVTLTPEMRQMAYDNYSLTDDHGMHATGLVKDQNGTKYFIIKNSWDTNNKYKGYLYMSEAFARLNTMNIIVHKDAIPKAIKKKLDIE